LRRGHNLHAGSWISRRRVPSVNFCLILWCRALCGSFNRAIELDSGYAKTYNNRGMVWYEKGEPDLALSDYEKALELDVNNTNTHINIGLIWYDKNRNDLMCQSFEKACQLGACEKLIRVRRDNLCREINPVMLEE
jgi:hypothetical protein